MSINNEKFAQQIAIVLNRERVVVQTVNSSFETNEKKIEVRKNFVIANRKQNSIKYFNQTYMTNEKLLSWNFDRSQIASNIVS